MFREIEKKEISPFANTIEYIIKNNILGKLDYSFIYDRIEIDNILVEEKYRGQKIGTKLMGYLISIAIEKKVKNITLEVRVSNNIAIKLYKNFGFKEVAIRKYYYGDEDALLMEKKVM